MTSTFARRYPGALPFADDPLSRSLFFGRRAERMRLLNQVIANRLVVVYGRSGVGKTSLLRAGIADGLRGESFLPLTARVNDIRNGPMMSLLLDIEREAERQRVEYVPGSARSLWHYFKTVQFWTGNRLMTPVLILDQFEELFVMHAPADREQFVRQLGAVVRGVPPVFPAQLPRGGPASPSDDDLSPLEPAVRIVIATREDYLGYLDEVAEQIPAILDQRLRVAPLSVDNAREAIVSPAAVENPQLGVPPFTFAAGTVDAILEFLLEQSLPATSIGSRYVEPFQLQLVCDRAERVASAGKTPVTVADLGGRSGFEQILTDFYLARLRETPRRERRRVRTLCEAILISPDGHRLSVEQDEIIGITKITPAILERLVSERLLRSDRRASRIYYELSHDTLVESILTTRRGSQRALGITQIVGGLLGVILGVVMFGLSWTPVAGLTSKDPTPYWMVEVLLALAYAALGIAALIGGWAGFKTGKQRVRRYRPRDRRAPSSVPNV